MKDNKLYIHVHTHTHLIIIINNFRKFFMIINFTCRAIIIISIKMYICNFTSSLMPDVGIYRYNNNINFTKAIAKNNYHYFLAIIIIIILKKLP